MDDHVAKKQKKDPNYDTAWLTDFFVAKHEDTSMCLLCGLIFQLNDQVKIKNHFNACHSEYDNDFPKDSRDRSTKICSLLKCYPMLPKPQYGTVVMLDNMFTETDKSALEFSYKVAYLLARSERPPDDGSKFAEDLIYLFINYACNQDNEVKTGLMKKLHNVQLSVPTMQIRVHAIRAEILKQIDADLERCEWFSLQLSKYESINTASPPLCSVYVRMVFQDFNITEELLKVIPLNAMKLKDQDGFEKLKNFLTSKKIQLKKLVAVTASTACKEFIQCFKDDSDFSHVLTFNCITEELVLAASALQMSWVFNPIVNIVNTIRGSVHLKATGILPELLTEIEAIPKDSLSSKEESMLFEGRLLIKRFQEDLPQVRAFLQSKRELWKYPELQIKEWQMDLAFAVDISQHLHNLKVQLEGKSVVEPQIFNLYEYVKCFQQTVGLYAEHLHKNKLSANIFKHLTKTVDEMDSAIIFNGERFARHLEILKASFESRFKDFKYVEKIVKYFSCPIFNCDDTVEQEITSEIYNVFPDLSDPFLISREVVSIAHDENARRMLFSIAQDGKNIEHFWSALNQDEYQTLVKTFRRLMSCFGFTQLSRNLFSSMERIKSSLRSRTATDKYLNDVLTISSTSYRPDIEKLCETN
ncbi:general transcription factor II-I repeat domain-containing protein 2-like [Neodiprion pinetum]|uniref:general transcription factor II-I repeat domain-containing protein 2-like n=1 Tax=Neodiprion pinetum TaxID=441929 RepID=UPI001EDD1257|nr:general transcription factor II-I repeat domain-containing protein 2-like [Neodiprion pinetum]